MYHFSIPMALVDYIPVIFFGVAAMLLLGDLYNKMCKGTYALLSAGSVMVFLAGFCKSSWKLLYAANICDFVAFEQMFLPVNSLGLLFVGISLIIMLVRKGKCAMLSVAPVAFTGSLPFIVMMTLGLGGVCAGLSVLAAKMKKTRAMVLFILAFVTSMGMSAIAGQDMSLAWVNWTEQGINCVSQGCLLAGVIILHKSDLKNRIW